jgi:hypothetical protein
MRELAARILELLPLFLGYGLVCGFLAWLSWKRHTQEKRYHFPSSQLLLRPAGESLRVRLQQLHNQLMRQMLGLFCLPLVVWCLFYVFKVISSPWAWPIFVVGTGCVLLLAGRRINETYSSYWRKSYGFDGERAVAEELNHLMRDGFWVFHDMECRTENSIWNIDHIVIGHTGVFLIETKTRSRSEAYAANPDEPIIYDGRTLHFPSGKLEDSSLRQVFRNATHLGVWLREMTGEKLYVRAVLALPGWNIRNDYPKNVTVDVAVVNPQKIREHVLSYPANKIGPDTIQRVAKLCDERCRTISLG